MEIITPAAVAAPAEPADNLTVGKVGTLQDQPAPANAPRIREAVVADVLKRVIKVTARSNINRRECAMMHMYALVSLAYQEADGNVFAMEQLISATVEDTITRMKKPGTTFEKYDE